MQLNAATRCHILLSGFQKDVLPQTYSEAIIFSTMDNGDLFCEASGKLQLEREKMISKEDVLFSSFSFETWGLPVPV